jgi:hypothetical protein
MLVKCVEVVEDTIGVLVFPSVLPATSLGQKDIIVFFFAI